MKDWIRYTDPHEFPRTDYPRVTDYFVALIDEVNSKRPKHTIKEIIGLYPKMENEKLSTIVFPVFSTSKTSYATIKELAPIFANSFKNSSITPIISPYPYKIYEKPYILPRWTLKRFKDFGALLYDIDS